MPLLMIVLLFGVMYFMMIRPQQRRRREAMEMQNKLGPGDEIVTIGGLHGTVAGVEDDAVLVEIAPGVRVRFARQAIARVVTQVGATADEAVAAEPVGAETIADEPQSPVVETRKKD